MHEDQIFHQAAAIRSLADRAAFLDRACGSDPSLRQRIDHRLRIDVTTKQAALAAPEPDLEAGTEPSGDIPTVLVGTERPACPQGQLPAVPGYEVSRRIARGGMGVIYLARHLELNREVALKMMLEGAASSPEDLARFRAEAEAVAGVTHRHVVQIHEVGTHQGLPYLTLEYCPGGTLQDLCNLGPLPPRRAAVVMEQVARGVAAAHAQGLVHRDLKPANILIAEDGTPKVTDFGLAKKVDSAGMTATGMILGTPSYMAPEQATAGRKRVGPSADVWALGTILYQLLTGKLAFWDDDPMVTIRKVVEEEPARPRTINRDLPYDLEVICLKCLRKEPGQRYLSADSFADDLRRWLDGVPIEARPTGSVERAWKWLKRNPAAAVAVVALLLGVALSTVFGVRAESARGEAVAAKRAADENAAEAEARRAEAEQARDVMRAYGDFLEEDFLGVARPAGVQGGLGIGITVEQALLASEEVLATRFADQPLAEAKARHAIGVTWRNLGRYSKAEDHLVRAAEIRAARLGADHPDTDQSRESLAVTLIQAGRPGEAIPLLMRVVEFRLRVLGDAAAETLQARSTLATAYDQAGRTDEAISLYEATIDAMRRSLGDGDRLTLQTCHNLATVYSDGGRPVDAVSLYEQTLERTENSLGREHPCTLFTRQCLGYAYVLSGRQAEGASMLRGALQHAEHHLGKEHPDTVACRGRLARALGIAGKFPEAVPMLETAFAQMRQHLGEEHPDTLHCRDELALLYFHSGDLPKAIPLFELGLERQVRRLGGGHPLVTVARTNLAGAYSRVGRVAAAAEMLEGCLERSRGELGEEHWMTVQIRANLADAYRELGRADEAIPLFEQALARMRETLGETHEYTGSCRCNLALAYGLAGRVTDAIAMNEEAVKFAEQGMGEGHPNTLQLRHNLASLYLKHGRRAEAIPLLEANYRMAKVLRFRFPAAMDIQSTLIRVYEKEGRLEDEGSVIKDRLGFWKAAVPANPIQIHATQAQLADCLNRQGVYAEAEPLLRECLAHRKRSDLGGWLTANVEFLLGESLLGQENYAEAEPLLTAGYRGLEEAFTAEDSAAIPSADYCNGLLRRAAGRLVELYESTDRDSEAEQWRDKLAALTSPGD